SRNTTDFPVRVEKKLTAQGGIAVAVPAGAGADAVPATTLPPVGPLVQPDRAYLLKLEKARKQAEHTVTGALHRETMIDFAFALAAPRPHPVRGAGGLVGGRPGPAAGRPDPGDSTKSCHRRGPRATDRSRRPRRRAARAGGHVRCDARASRPDIRKPAELRR